MDNDSLVSGSTKVSHQGAVWGDYCPISLCPLNFSVEKVFQSTHLCVIKTLAQPYSLQIPSNDAHYRETIAVALLYHLNS